MVEISYYFNGKAHEKSIINNGKYIVVNSKYISSDGSVKKYSNKQIFPLLKNDIVFVLSDVPNGKALAKSRLINKDNLFTLNQRIACIRAQKNYDANFLSMTLNRNKYFLKFDDGSGQTNLSKNDILKFMAKYPNFKEQKSISNLINIVQDLITFNEENLKNYNKLIRLLNSYIFNEVFKSKNNHNAWNEQKLSEVVDIFDGTHQTPTYTEYGIPFYSVENIKNMETNKYISKNDFFKEFKNVPESGDIFLTRIGDVGTSNVYTKKESAAYYVSLALLKTKSINSNYLHALLNSNNMQRNIWKKTLHVAFPKKINKNEIGKLSVMMTTNICEQEQIGKLFKIINLKINFIDNKLQSLKTLKKYLMQNMFI